MAGFGCIVEGGLAPPAATGGGFGCIVAGGLASPGAIDEGFGCTVAGGLAPAGASVGGFGCTVVVGLAPPGATGGGFVALTGTTVVPAPDCLVGATVGAGVGAAGSLATVTAFTVVAGTATGSFVVVPTCAGFDGSFAAGPSSVGPAVNVCLGVVPVGAPGDDDPAPFAAKEPANTETYSAGFFAL